MDPIQLSEPEAASSASAAPPRPARAKGKGGQTLIVVLIAIVVVAAAVGVTLYRMNPQLFNFDLGGQQQAAANPTPAPASPPATPPPTPPAPPPATPSRESAEARLLADPIDGPFFREFRDTLPGDYSAVMGYLLVQVPDPARDMQRFDELLGERLGVMRFANAQDVAGASDAVLDEMADNMLNAMRAPEYCQASIDPTIGGLDPANTFTRRLGVKINLSIIRAIASGRQGRVAREEPTPKQVDDFNTSLQKKLHVRQWQAYLAGAMDRLPPDEQCAIYVGVWNVIADYPPALSAIWTASQMAQPAQ